MEDDGSQLRQLKLDGYELYSGSEAWSPDGQAIAFGASHGSQFGIYLMRPDGSDIHALIEGVEVRDVVAWSPDGMQLAFTQQPPGPSASQVYVIDSDGSNLRALTDSIGYNENPSWAPDGRQIVFDSDRAGNHDLYSMNADGSDQRNLTNDPARDYAYRWLPDGRIVFSSDRDGGGWFTMNADGSDVRPLTILRSDDYAPDWSPDGSLIAFGNGGDIYSMRTDGTQRRNLTVYPTSSNVPRWSQDGQQILFEDIRNDYQLPPVGSAGAPQHIILRAGDAQQAGSAGAYCWNEGGSGQLSDWIGVGIPEQPITITSAGPQLQALTLDVSALGTPTAFAVEVYDYAAANARGRIINGAFVAPCAAPGGTEDGCVVRRVNAPATAITQAPVQLPSGEYIVVVSAAFAGADYSGFTRQGFHVVVVASSAATSGEPPAFTLRSGDQTQRGGVGPGCWEGEGVGVCTDGPGIAFATQPLTLRHDDMLTFEFADLGAPDSARYSIYRYDSSVHEADSAGALYIGPLCTDAGGQPLPDCDGTTWADQLPSGQTSDLRLPSDLPAGEYVLVLEAMYSQHGTTLQGFHVVVTEGE
jgi:TolB protein